MPKRTSTSSNPTALTRPPASRSAVAGKATMPERAGTGAESGAEPKHFGLAPNGKGGGVSLKTGSYLIRYIPVKPVPEVLSFDGTLRISREKKDGTLIEADQDNREATEPKTIKASADLYERSTRPEEAKVFDDLYANFKGIPSFPSDTYRFYMEGFQVLEGLPAPRNVTARFRVHRYDRDSRSLVPMGNRVCILYQYDPAELGPNDEDPRTSEFENCEEYYGGRIIDEGSGIVVGKVRVGRISDKLRKAEVEIDCVGTDAEKVANPQKIASDSLAKDWADAFMGTGWEVNAGVSSRNVAKPPPNEGDPEQPDGAWTLTELHQAMMQRHDRKKLEGAWHYYVLCVPRLVDFERGVMFDAGGTDDDSNIPHDVAGVAADWPFPSDDPPWKSFAELAGKRLQDTNAYFRTAVHELGHAMGLDHNFSDNGFMNTTDIIANKADLKNPFPENIQMSFHPLDQARLRHEPDLRVRADASFEGRHIIAPDAQEGEPVKGLQLHLAPHLAAVPYGAPVRVRFHLENTLDESIRIPENLSLKAGNVRGSVIDPAGSVRSFSPIVWRLDETQFKSLEKRGHDDTYSATLLRGPQGALFSVPGQHRIQLVVSWVDGGSMVSLKGEATVTVTPPADEDHRLAALMVLATPETLLSLVVGGDHLLRGNAVIDAAIDNPVLKPHFALIKARRLASGYCPCKKNKKTGIITWEHATARPPKPVDALAVMTENTVLAPEELRKAAWVIDHALKSAARDAQGDPGRLDKLVENHSAASAAVVARLARVLNERVDRMIKYDILQPEEKTVKVVRSLPQSEEAVKIKFADYVYESTPRLRS